MDFEIGERIRVDSQIATILYIGKVEGYGEQVWVGVEWDDEKRGKHDGIVKGVRYFQTKHPTGGSLVKVQNITKPLDLLAEIQSRYIGDEDDVEDEIDLVQTSKKIELVGMQKTAMKQSNIEKLVNIVLDNRCVGLAPPQNSPIFTNCRELNLYGNLIYKWKTVQNILKYFPKIHELNLRRNRMQEIEENYEIFSESCRKLVISECQITQKSISPILKMFPNLTEIVAFGNELNKIEIAENLSRNITVLDLEDNPIQKFSNISGNFENLLHLNLSNCGFTEINKIGDFENLESLNLRGNLITKWSSINELKKLGKLKKLLFDCKNLECEKGVNVFEVIIAKLEKLEDLNRFDVSEVERRSAEIRFLNKYATLKIDAEHLSDIERMIKKHGEPSVDTAKKGLSVVKIRIQFENRIETRSLPLGMTVQKIRDMLARLFKISADSIRIYLEMSENSKKHRIELENPLREFGHYSPNEERDVLIVEGF
ncbi:unnamed protein product [Caenorhabditis angaria]|uniref:Tubulin-specific chaperone E n=1 Tax=Caenorhabditis angaria TaxID=860376 RepID=A0A9P1ITP0_9PELO|nr:unnamed protein product [Caenorhabditis angaria]